MQNLMLNTANRIANTVNRPQSIADQSAQADANRSFEQLLDKQVHMRQQKANRGISEQTQSTKNKMPKATEKAVLNTEAKSEASLKKTPAEEGASGISAQLNEMPNPLEIMWANVMTANALAKQTSQPSNHQTINADSGSANQLANDVTNQDGSDLANRLATDLTTIKAGQLIRDSLKQTTINTEAHSSGLVNSALSKTILAEQAPLKANETVIPDGKLPTEQVRWLDLPANQPSDIKFGDIKPNDLRLVDKSSAELTLQADKTADLQTPVVLTQMQNTTTTSANQLAMTQAQTPGASNYIQAYLGKSEWQQAISQKVMWMIGANEQTATLTLNPPDLGPLQVVVSINNDKADATFISENAEVRQALQDGLANLRDKMSESGLQLGQANINASADSGHQSAFLNGRQQQTFNRTPQGVLNAASDQEQASVTGAVGIQSINGLVDTFV